MVELEFLLVCAETKLASEIDNIITHIKTQGRINFTRYDAALLILGITTKSL